MYVHRMNPNPQEQIESSQTNTPADESRKRMVVTWIWRPCDTDCTAHFQLAMLSEDEADKLFDHPATLVDENMIGDPYVRESTDDGAAGFDDVLDALDDYYG